MKPVPIADSAAIDQNHPVVLFDGVCNLCNGAVTWALEHEAHDRLRFASLQSPIADSLLRAHGQLPPWPDSMVYVDESGVYIRSDAALRIAANMRAPWSWLSAARVVPRPIRDLVYRVIARNRYRWFGRRDQCMLPASELRSRFLETAAR